jgi:hypothetical protein
LGQALHGGSHFRVRFRSENARLRGETLSGYAHSDFGVSAQILKPVRGIVLGDDVEAAFAVSEPDFDSTRAAAAAASRGEIEILFAIKIWHWGSILRQSALLAFKLQLTLVFFKELAEILGGVEQTGPLLVIQRDWKTAKAVNADSTFLRHSKFHGSAALFGFDLLFQILQASFEFFVTGFRHKNLE